MSMRLATLLEESRSKIFPNDQKRFDWLQEEGAKIAAAYTHPDVTLREMLERYAIEASTGSAMSRAEGWAVATRTLAAAHPDPDDVLYGLFIATEVWVLGLEYNLTDMARFVARACAIPYDGEKTGDPAQDAHDLYEMLLNRVIDLDSMLQGELDDEEIVAWEWSKNPDTLSDAMDLLYRSTNEHIERVENEEGREVGVEELDEIVRWSGHMLWACYHASQTNVPFEVLAEFARMYPDDWSDIFRALLAESVIASDVLAALSETDAHADQVLATGAEAVSLYRADPPPDLTILALGVVTGSVRNGGESANQILVSTFVGNGTYKRLKAQLAEWGDDDTRVLQAKGMLIGTVSPQATTGGFPQNPLAQAAQHVTFPAPWNQGNRVV